MKLLHEIMRHTGNFQTHSVIENGLYYCKLAESATWSSGRSSVDTMTILLIAFDSTPIHYTVLRWCSHTFSTLGYILSKKNCVKSVNFGQERAENRTTSRSATIGVESAGPGAVLPPVQYRRGRHSLCLASGVFALIYLKLTACALQSS